MKRFSELLSETMDVTLRQLFGESASALIYRFMELHQSLKQEEIAEKIETFYAFLEKLLGLEEAQIIQAASLKGLYLKLRREYEEVEEYFSFLDELYEIKFKLFTPSFKEEGSVCN